MEFYIAGISFNLGNALYRVYFGRRHSVGEPSDPAAPAEKTGAGDGRTQPETQSISVIARSDSQARRRSPRNLLAVRPILALPSQNLPGILVALDVRDPSQAARLLQQVAGYVAGYKIGLEFFYANGISGIDSLRSIHPNFFLDLKLHDIPHTVAEAVRALIPLRPFMLNVHAAGGLAMMQAARDAAQEEAAKRGIAAPKLIAVTVLTSLDEKDLDRLGQREPIADQVCRLAGLTQRAGLDGVVCSPQEISRLRKEFGPDFLLVTPGVRPETAKPDDQKRTLTPGEAARLGSHYLVIGRPITQAPDPAAAAEAVRASIAPV